MTTTSPDTYMVYGDKSGDGAYSKTPYDEEVDESALMMVIQIAMMRTMLNIMLDLSTS